MKKLLSIICAVCLTVSFAGCGKKEENKKVTSSTPSSSSSDISSEDNQSTSTSSEANLGVSSGNNKTLRRIIISPAERQRPPIPKKRP